ncbi:MAG TPA: menaquinone biosynthesis decarboxylase [Nitrospiraceae bacterium]|nr:menaquinone biosynthesis decarboxylase [Nitrospiraceae bacterium]
MAYDNLRDFIQVLEKNGELIRIKAEVDAALEVAEITDRVSKQQGVENKALLFERVKGHSLPILTNAFGSHKRICLALEVESLDAIGNRIRESIDPTILFPGPGAGIMDKIGMLPKLAELSNYFPKTVKKAPCQEVVFTGDQVDLSRLPVLTCWPGDGGPFITLPMVCTVDPQTSITNVGMYRMQVFDGQTTGMHWHKHKDGARHYMHYEGAGKRMEIAVALGGDPSIIYSSTAPLPPAIGEYVFAGFLRNKALEVVQCKTVDIRVPAEAELVLEGYIDPGERRREGPFGDHTGYYSEPDEYPVFHLTAITHRKDAIYPATLVGKPPQEDEYLGKATERIFLPLLQMVAPDIIDMDMPVEGVFHNNVIVKIRKRYPGHGKKAIHTIWGTGMLMLSKFVIVCDEDVNIHDYSEVTWKVMNHVDPQRDVVISDGPLDILDHSCPQIGFGGKMGIDATRKGPGEGFHRPWPDEIKMDPKVQKMVEERWKEYGF